MTIVVRGHLNMYMYMYLSYDMYNEGVLHSTETVIILYYCDIMHVIVSIIITFLGGGGGGSFGLGIFIIKVALDMILLL